MAEMINTDSMMVTRDEAVEHTIHHLELAALFYQSTPDDNNAQLLEELRRVNKRNILGENTPSFVAARAFIAAIHLVYEKMKEEDHD